jgi:hypothetical protein
MTKGLFVILVGTVALTFGCFHTKTLSQARPTYAEHEARQWFTIGGLVPLSQPAGEEECGPKGLAYSDSRMSGTDVLINIGIMFGSVLVASSVCDSGGDATAYAQCVQGLSFLGPLLIGSRTVNYACSE